MKILTRTEEIILTTVWKLKDNACGITINEYINKNTGMNWKFGSIYTPLGRLVEKGYLKSIEGEPTAVRGGRRKIFFRLTDEGKNALVELQKVHDAVWTDMPSLNSRAENGY